VSDLDYKETSNNYYFYIGFDNQISFRGFIYKFQIDLIFAKINPYVEYNDCLLDQLNEGETECITSESVCAVKN